MIAFWRCLWCVIAYGAIWVAVVWFTHPRVGVMLAYRLMRRGCATSWRRVHSAEPFTVLTSLSPFTKEISEYGSLKAHLQIFARLLFAFTQTMNVTDLSLHKGMHLLSMLQGCVLWVHGMANRRCGGVGVKKTHRTHHRRRC